LNLKAGTGIAISDDGSGGVTIATSGGGGSVPQSIGGLYIWCAADQLTGYSNGDPVKSWLNLAGGPALTVEGTAPTYVTGVINSLPVIRFGGSGYLDGYLPDLVAAHEATIFLVMKISSLTQAYTGIIHGEYDAVPGYYIKSNGKSAFYANGTNYDGAGAATFTTSSFYIVTVIMGPVGLQTRVALAADYTSTSTGFQSMSNGPRMALGTDTHNSGRTLTGDIAEFIGYRRALSTSEVSTIENYLKTKYGL
jgi:hypothetical protein